MKLGKLNPRKSSPIESIPAKDIKQNSDIFAPVLQSHFNTIISQNDFPEVLKAGDITSLYKKDDNPTKKHYRPIAGNRGGALACFSGALPGLVRALGVGAGVALD